MILLKVLTDWSWEMHNVNVSGDVHNQNSEVKCYLKVNKTVLLI